jgi:hypothetical protein
MQLILVVALACLLCLLQTSLAFVSPISRGSPLLRSRVTATAKATATATVTSLFATVEESVDVSAEEKVIVLTENALKHLASLKERTNTVGDMFVRMGERKRSLE